MNGKGDQSTDRKLVWIDGPGLFQVFFLDDI
jgi:hypothetical protein